MEFDTPHSRDVMLKFAFDRNCLAVATAIAVLGGCHDSPTQPIPDEVQVTASASLIQVGDSISLSAAFLFGATNQAADDRVRWTSSDSTAFTVDNSGRGHALKYTGMPITVTATASGVSGTTELQVLPKFDSLIVTVSATLATGRTVRPTLAVHVVGDLPYVQDSRFQQLPELSAQVQLSSSDPATVSVASDGSVTAKAVGHATISGQLLGQRSTVAVDVVDGYAVKSLSGTEAYTVKGVNDAGAIIASVSGGADYGGSDVLRQDGTVTDLGDCSAHDINNAGQIACEVVGASHALPGVFSNGTLTVLFDSPTYYSGASTGITESGTVFGLVRNAVGTPALFLATSNGVTIPALAGYWYGDSYAINGLNHAVVVGRAAQYPYSSILSGSSEISLTPLSGRWAEARDINDADDVVGWSEGWGGLTATVWRASNNWRPESPSYRAGRPAGISETGQVIGNGSDGPYVWRAGRYTILNDALATKDWTLTKVSAISRSGIVAGEATNSAGAKSVVLIDLGMGQ